MVTFYSLTVIIIAELREIYDRFGEEMLKAGVPPENTEDKASKKNPYVIRGGYRFSGNTLEIFEKFFGTDNPFTITLDNKGNQISAIEELAKPSGEPCDLYVTVECTLEELFFGCKKDIHFKRHTLNAASGDKVVEVTRSIEVKPGMGGSDVKFPGEGHVRFGQKQGDLIVKLIQKAHPKFKRQGNDIIYFHKLSLLDSLRSTPIHFTTIENVMLEIAVDEVIN